MLGKEDVPVGVVLPGHPPSGIAKRLVQEPPWEFNDGPLYWEERSHLAEASGSGPEHGTCPEKGVLVLLLDQGSIHTEATYPQVHNIWWQDLGQQGR